MNFSKQREIIKNIFSNNKGQHFEIDDIFNLAKTELPKIGIATVYRNINILLKEGYIRQLPINNFKIVYDLFLEEHDHLICQECGKIVDTKINTSNLCITNNFNVDKHHIIIIGTCFKCSKKD